MPRRFAWHNGAVRAALLLLPVLFSACGAREPDPPAAAERDAAARTPARPSTERDAAPAPPWEPAEGKELLGSSAPGWSAERAWFNSDPLTLEELRGKVVLIRWWTTGCGLCVATAPALNDFHARFAARGLVVLGFHHPKSDDAHKPEVVRGAAKRLGFEFPVAQDEDWSVLNRWWFAEGAERDYTSASFLLDRKGVIRWIHPGGEYHSGGGDGHEECRTARKSLEEEIVKLLDESP